MLRLLIGILGGALVWMPAFFILARLLFFVWPDYALHAQTWITAQVYDFTPSMSVCNALFWFLAETAAGWVAVAIARRREAAWVLAALVMGYMSFMHLYYVWDSLPWWYNLAVALPSGAAVLVGGTLAAKWVRPRLVAATSGG
jgi:hypothetical protein